MTVLSKKQYLGSPVGVPFEVIGSFPPVQLHRSQRRANVDNRCPLDAHAPRTTYTSSRCSSLQQRQQGLTGAPRKTTLEPKLWGVAYSVIVIKLHQPAESINYIFIIISILFIYLIKSGMK